MKVISFSLWGNKPMYTIGAIKNAEFAKIIYPEFQCWFYIHQETVPQEIIDQLVNMKNTKIIFKSGNLSECKPMMWRFEAIDDDDVSIMLVRDTDTRFLLREKLAVDEWLHSEKLFHIMRDHPHHNFKILGGMFGTRKLSSLKNWKNIINTYIQHGNKNYDQNFLLEHIYPLIKNDSLIHASFNKYEEHCVSFPIEYDNTFQFVGEYVYEDDKRSNSHIIDLKKAYYHDRDANKIHWISSFYIISKKDPKSIQRNNEILECLYKNIHNPFISKIHLFVDDVCALNKVIELNKHNKIHIIEVGKQPLYSDLFEYAMDNLSEQICMISNSDIYLYECDLTVLSQLDKYIYALSRHEHDLTCKVLGFGSHDSFLFHGSLLKNKKEILKNMNHIQNLAGSDDNIVNILSDHGFKLLNPCFEIKIIHLHSSELRTYSSEKVAHGKYFIKQQYLLKESVDKHFTFYPGKDIIGQDVSKKNNCTIDDLKMHCLINGYDSFNTLGFIKNNINIDELTETDWINKNTNHGIFIRKK